MRQPDPWPTLCLNLLLQNMVHYFVNSLPPGYWMVQLWRENVRSFKTLQGQLYIDYLFRFPIILLVLRENWTSVDLPRPLLCEVQIYPLGAWGLGILLYLTTLPLVLRSMRASWNIF